MNTTSPETPDQSMKATFVAVIIVEVLIIAALWALGRMFA